MDARMHGRATLTLASSLALAALAHAGVIVVDAAGGGDFADLPVAIAAAAEGDTLLVEEGTYTAFELVDKGLHVVADVDATVTVNGATLVEGLSTGKTVLISGVDFVGAEATFIGSEQQPPSPGLEIGFCDGAVRVQDGELTGGAGVYFPEDVEPPYGWHGAYVKISTDVAFTSCILRGGEPDDVQQTDLEPYDGGFGGSGLGALDSRVTVNRCILVGADGGDAAIGGGGGWGCLAISTNLVAIHSTFRGGDGGWGWDFLGSCGAAGNGVGLYDAVMRDLTCLFFGGNGGPGPDGTCPDGVGVLMSGTGTRVPLSGAPRAVFVDRVVRDGEGFQAVYYGKPGDTVILANAPETAFRYRPLFRGVWLLDRPWPGTSGGVTTGTSVMRGVHAPPVALGVEGTIGSSLTISVDHTLPPLPPGVEDRVIWYQATMVDTDGDPIVTNVEALVLIDAAF